MRQISNILIIDDDDDDKEIFIEVVGEIDESITCTTASNGFEAIQILEENVTYPDLIFLDLNMPRMGGKQCLETIKKNVKFKDIPVIIYTTSKLAEDKEEAIGLGAINFITKPSSTACLKKELELAFHQIMAKRNSW
ncbi:MAG TPA: response regulator [Segetibacter sp.]|nr:response regulator [Segetibacter sp.]